MILPQPTHDSGTGLERSCDPSVGEWMLSAQTGGGVEYLEARFLGAPYRRHRHDTYAICLTTQGVQEFSYRGSTETSLPGQVVVLHPDELHDGRAATEAGFGYRQLYVDPSLVFEAVRAVTGQARPLPFVARPVVTNRRLAAAVGQISPQALEPLAADSLVVLLAEGLLQEAGSHAVVSRRLDLESVRRARRYLDVNRNRVVRSAELENECGMSRYELARQFRLVCGTSPYRYSLMRRLGRVRTELAGRRDLASIALGAGFADQAHLTRLFKAAYGMTPARYRTLQVRGAE